MVTKIIRLQIAAIGILLGLTTIALAQTSRSSFPNITIKNFGQMDTHYYRGGQPRKDEYKALADLGVKTVIDLRDDPEEYEKPAVEALGMKYVNIPMADDEYPKPENIEAFLKLMNDPETGTVFVHCKGEKHRAGVTGAVYRFTKYGWNYDQAMQEMLNYDFHTRWGRKVMKKFVEDYAAKTQAAKIAVPASETAAGSQR